MVKEQYCSFEVAKLLKEKGFDVYCNTYYTNDGYFNSDVYGNTVNFCCEAPTHQMALAWLREKGVLLWVYPTPLLTADNRTFQWMWDGEKQRHDARHFGHLRSYDTYEYDTYEEAVESALKYALENLI